MRPPNQNVGGGRVPPVPPIIAAPAMYKPFSLIHTTRPDAMQQFCRVGSGGVNWTKSPRRKKNCKQIEERYEASADPISQRDAAKLTGNVTALQPNTTI